MPGSKADNVSNLSILVDAAEVADRAASDLQRPLKKRSVQLKDIDSSIQAPSVKPSSEIESAHSREHFPQFLMSVLENEEYHDQIAWMPSGEAFTVVNTKAFKTDIMPKLFKIRIMSSFIRKLSRWGFHRVHDRHSKNSDIFRHDDFQRGRWDLCKTIKSVAKPSITAGYRGNSHVARSVSTAPSSAEETRAPQAPVSPEGARSLAEGRPLGPPPSLAPCVPHSLATMTSGSPMGHVIHVLKPREEPRMEFMSQHSQQALVLATVLARASKSTSHVTQPPMVSQAYADALAQAKALIFLSSLQTKAVHDSVRVMPSTASSSNVPGPSETLVRWLQSQLPQSRGAQGSVMQTQVNGTLPKLEARTTLRDILGSVKMDG